MKRFATYLLAIATSAFLLTACGGKTQEKGTQNDVTKETIANSKTTDNKDSKPTGGESANSNTSEETTVAKASDSKEGETVESPKTDAKFVEGTFTGLEQGDLFYFNIKDKAGKDHSFTVMKTDAVYEKISAKPEEYKGKKMKVYYKKVKKFIENAGGNVEFEEYIKAELL